MPLEYRQSTAHDVETPSRKKPKLAETARNNDRNNDSSPASNPQGKLDPTYGQRAAFPGLDSAAVAAGDQEDVESEAAIAYLRSVRDEAKSVPTLLVAPLSSTSHEDGASVEGVDHASNDTTVDQRTTEMPSDPIGLGQGRNGTDSRGYYRDGAYTALPTASQIGEQTIDIDDEDPQEAYYANLITRFKNHRSLFPDPEELTTPSDTNPASSLLSYCTKRATWRSKLLNNSPTFAILASLPYESVIFGLDVLGELLMSHGNMRNRHHARNLGAWTWGLLGRCRPQGEMDSEDVSVVREVGKKAVWRMKKALIEPDAEEAEGQGEDEGKAPNPKSVVATPATGHTTSEQGNDQAETDEDQISAVKTRMLQSLQDGAEDNGGHEETDTRDSDAEDTPPASDKTATHRQSDVFSRQDILASLDTIVTIIGEVYGQRDLLDQRILWEDL